MYKWLNAVLCIFAVTPHAGVRIEMEEMPMTERLIAGSPPTRGCELKYFERDGLALAPASPPTWGCELKFCKLKMDAVCALSPPPTRGCESKYRS